MENQAAVLALISMAGVLAERLLRYVTDQLARFEQGNLRTLPRPEAPVQRWAVFLDHLRARVTRAAMTRPDASGAPLEESLQDWLSVLDAYLDDQMSSFLAQTDSARAPQETEHGRKVLLLHAELMKRLANGRASLLGKKAPHARTAQADWALARELLALELANLQPTDTSRRFESLRSIRQPAPPDLLGGGIKNRPGALTRLSQSRGGSVAPAIGGSYGRREANYLTSDFVLVLAMASLRRGWVLGPSGLLTVPAGDLHEVTDRASDVFISSCLSCTDRPAHWLRNEASELVSWVTPRLLTDASQTALPDQLSPATARTQGSGRFNRARARMRALLTGLMNGGEASDALCRWVVLNAGPRRGRQGDWAYDPVCGSSNLERFGGAFPEREQMPGLPDPPDLLGLSYLATPRGVRTAHQYLVALALALEVTDPHGRQQQVRTSRVEAPWWGRMHEDLCPADGMGISQAPKDVDEWIQLGRPTASTLGARQEGRAFDHSRIADERGHWLVVAANQINERLHASEVMGAYGVRYMVEALQAAHTTPYPGMCHARLGNLAMLRPDVHALLGAAPAPGRNPGGGPVAAGPGGQQEVSSYQRDAGAGPPLGGARGASAGPRLWSVVVVTDPGGP